MKKAGLLTMVWMCMVGMGSWVYAQQPAASTVNSATNSTVSTNQQQGIEVYADRLEYEADSKLMIAVGNVVIKQNADTLTADSVTVQKDTEEVYATGNVIFERNGRIWKGDELHYNFKTQQGDFGEFRAFMDPLYLIAEDSERKSEDEIVLEHARITTCEGERPTAYARARKADIIGQKTVRAHNVVFFLGPIPVFYAPFFTFNTERKTNIDFLPGYRSTWGFYALSAYNYKIYDPIGLVGATRVDYRTDRGWGFGQDFKWTETNKYMNGKFLSYYIDDQQPFRDENEKKERPELTDTGRYRLKLQHTENFTDRDYVRINFGYLSDPYVLEDFFTEEYQYTAEPETRASLTHRGDKFTAGILVDKRLNDFYTHVDRLPELTLDFRRQPIADSGLYYQGNNAGAYLKLLHKELDDSKDYDVMRLDTDNQLYYPARFFGFLNMTPRAGYRGTYYSKTVKVVDKTTTRSVTTQVVTGGVTNDVVTTTNVTEQVVENGKADIRNVYQLGLLNSFKAFKVFIEPSADGNGGLRHVAEPYVDYTFQPRPNLEPKDLFYFDKTESVDRFHAIQVGMRNKLQTKRRATFYDFVAQNTNAYGIVHDLLDVNIYSFYFVEKEEWQEDWSDIFYTAEIKPNQWSRLRIDGSYDSYNSAFRENNTQLSIVFKDLSTFALEHRYRKDIENDKIKRNLISAEVDLFPDMRWSPGAYMRYDFEEGYLEEQSYYLERRFDCIGCSIGYTGRGDDWDWWLKIWLLAYPDSLIGGEGHY